MTRAAAWIRKPAELSSLGLLCAVSAATLGCTSEMTPQPPMAACVQSLQLDCTPAYTPSFDALFRDVFSAGCGSSTTGQSCHYGPTAATAQGGLVLSDPAIAYDTLLGTSSGRPLVLPGDPHCSVLIERLKSSDPAFRMPRGSVPLPEATRCAVRQWIANGAVR